MLCRFIYFKKLEVEVVCALPSALNTQIPGKSEKLLMRNSKL
jgi:hypothetical protein